MVAGDAVLDDRFGVMTGEKIEVDAYDCKSATLVKGELSYSGISRTYFERMEPLVAGLPNAVFHQTAADAPPLKAFVDGKIDQLCRKGPRGEQYIFADDPTPQQGDETPSADEVVGHGRAVRVGEVEQIERCGFFNVQRSDRQFFHAYRIFSKAMRGEPR